MTHTHFEGWTPSRSLDVESRRRKTRKMIELLRSWRRLEGARVLDIGTGAGVSAATIAEAVAPDGRVSAVDVHDLRVFKDGFDFHLTEGTDLPFPERSFDITISNLVIEHVGERDQQLNHLSEIRRVLDDSGCGYIAMPNRWAPVEPHFGVPFLTWVPRRFRTPYLRATKKAKIYDCLPLSYREATTLFREAGLRYSDETYAAMQIMRKVDKPWIGTRLLLSVPRFVYRLLRPVIPTFIFKLEPATSSQPRNTRTEVVAGLDA